MRLYITPSWRDAAEGHDAWSMESPDDRKRRSHTLSNGNANLQSYSDEAIGLAIGEKNKSKISIKDKILPQAKRLTTLRQQMVELEQEYKTTDMSISEYSVLRDVLFAKAQRAEVLYRKAIAQKPVQIPEDEPETHYTINNNAQPNDGYTSEEYEEIGVRFIDQLSNGNSFKKILQKGCKGVRMVVHLSHKARSYWQELKAV